MGEVYKAYDTHRDRYVALKLLPEAFSDDREYLRRFQRESHVAARLTEPHVIPIHDFGEIDGRLFIDMRLVDGTDISTLLNTDGRIAPHRAVYLIRQVAQALDAAHADRLVHRDIKPSNILVTRSDFVYVVDFGIARPVGGQQTALTITGATIGTLHYMAPERFIGHDVDGRADVYSLACVLHECLTGAPPFTGKDLAALMYAQLYYSPPPASSLVKGVPPALDAVIACGMAKRPEDRFPTAGALAAAALEALPAEVPAPSPPPMMERLQAPVWYEASASRWQAPTVADAWHEAAKPPGPEAEQAGDRPATSIPYSPTETVLAVGGRDWGGTRPDENMPQGTRPDLVSGGLPPDATTGEPARGPAWRRLGLQILAVAAVLAVPVVLILLASARPNAGGASPTLNPDGATRTGAAGAPGLALPAVAGKIQIGQNPSYIQVAPNGKFAYIANPGAGAISVIDTATDLVSGTIKIPQGPPQFVSFSADSRTAYVSVYNTRGSVHLIAFIDTSASAVTGTTSVDNFTPGPSTSSPDGRYLYVPNHNTAMSGAHENEVDVIDTASRKMVSEIAVPANPHWVAFDKNGRLYTTDHMSATVTVLNAQNNSIITNIQVGETPHSEAISPDGSRLAVTSFDGNKVFLIDTATDKEIKQIPVGRNPLNIAYSPDGRYLCTTNNDDNTVTVIDTADYHVIGVVRTGKNPTSISMLPNGHQAYVTDDGSGAITILNFPK